jgi:hypothetical protein
MSLSRTVWILNQVPAALQWQSNNFNCKAELSIRFARCWPQNKLRCKLFTTDRQTDRPHSEWQWQHTFSLASWRFSEQRPRADSSFVIRDSKIHRRSSSELTSAVQKHMCSKKVQINSVRLWRRRICEHHKAIYKLNTRCNGTGWHFALLKSKPT